MFQAEWKLIPASSMSHMANPYATSLLRSQALVSAYSLQGLVLRGHSIKFHMNHHNEAGAESFVSVLRCCLSMGVLRSSAATTSKHVCPSLQLIVHRLLSTGFRAQASWLV